MIFQMCMKFNNNFNNIGIDIFKNFKYDLYRPFNKKIDQNRYFMKQLVPF